MGALKTGRIALESKTYAGSPRKSSSEAVKRVLVLGGAGYLGSVIVGQLLHRGFAVRILDALLFGGRSLEDFRGQPGFAFTCGDIRNRGDAERAMTGCDAVVHLAAIVGDAACEQQKTAALAVNRDATPMLAEVARGCGVRRFIFASSCSVYGASEELLDETSRLNPLSVYATTKQDSERILLSAESSKFAPTILRLGTLFGLSPRMRFDLIVNLFVAQAASSGRITVWNGDQWRPFLHVQDAARAFLACLDASPETVSGKIFNVGSPSLNCQIRKLGEEIVRLVPGVRLCSIASPDKRNYRVSFDRIARVLGFRCERSLSFGIREIYRSLGANHVPPGGPQFHSVSELENELL